MAVLPTLALVGMSADSVAEVSSVTSQGRTLAKAINPSPGFRILERFENRRELRAPALVPTAMVAAAAVPVLASPPRSRPKSGVLLHPPLSPTATVPRPPPPPAPPAPSQAGPASWYGAPAGTCAHPSLPLGTIVTVTDVANGRSVTCTIQDRGPYAGGRILDMSASTFSQLAPLSVGVINVRITW